LCAAAAEQLANGVNPPLTASASRSHDLVVAAWSRGPPGWEGTHYQQRVVIRGGAGCSLYPGVDPGCLSRDDHLGGRAPSHIALNTSIEATKKIWGRQGRLETAEAGPENRGFAAGARLEARKSRKNARQFRGCRQFTGRPIPCGRNPSGSLPTPPQLCRVRGRLARTQRDGRPSSNRSPMGGLFGTPKTVIPKLRRAGRDR
jgi:hypothetical protein